MKTGPHNVNGKRSIRGIKAEAVRFFKITPYAISLIWKYQPRLFVILSISTILEGISPCLSVWIMRYLLDAVVSAYQHQGQSEYVRRAVYLLIFQIVVIGGFACIAKGMTYFKSVLSLRFSLDVQADLISGLAHLEMKDYDNPEIYDMISRAKDEAQNNKPLLLVSRICDMSSSLITWLSFSIILLKFSPMVVFAMFVICVPYFILNVYYGNVNFKIQFNRTHEQRAATYLFSCLTDRRSLPEIITGNLWTFLKSKWSALTTKFMHQDISKMKHRLVIELAIIGFAYVGRGGASLYIILKCLEHFADYTVGQIMMYFQAFSGGIGALAQLMQQLSGIYEGSCFLQNYQQFLEVKKPVIPLANQQRRVLAEIESVEFRNVGFTYPGSSASALQGINLIFKKGQSTLLVGKNGAGKTTLARLLVGLYAPSEGVILINGYDMQEYDKVLLRRKMAIIFQDFVRYSLTAKENIGLGSTEHIDNLERIINASKAARLHEIIVRMPDGYNTMLGREFRGGRDLSLGEWQRICLARLFMKDASLMLYDEPSASLDIETESEVLREINLTGKDRICILISHRMLRADLADRIVVIDKGKIVEHGDHDALVSDGGRYAHLWKTYHHLKDTKTLFENA
jgi:ABC-type multidrug transport system fused ATPase/permease subunit